MKHMLTFFLCAFTLVGMAQNPHSGTNPFIISEIMYNPPESGDDSLEYIEITSLVSVELNLGGYFFSAGVIDTFTSDVVLPANGTLVFAKNASALKNVFNGVNARQWKTGALKNGGEEVAISNPNGFVVTNVTYGSSSAGWPAEADGNGASLELCELTPDINDQSKWSYSRSNTGIIINGKEVAGSPGAPNTAECGGVVNPNTVVVRDFSFTPAEITIQEGETVTWDFQEGHHNVNGTQSTFPSNPASFKSGEPSPAPFTYSFTFNVPGDYSYQCDPHSTIMRGKVHVIPNNPTVTYPVRTIGQISTVDSDGKADSLDVVCEVKGIIYGVNMRATGLSATIIDANRDGIGLFNSKKDFGYNVNEGDEVVVRGKVDQYNGLTQIAVDTMWLSSSNNSVFDPRVVTALDESTESDLVVLSNMTLKDPNEWQKGKTFNATITDGTNDYTMRVVNVTTLSNSDAPSGAFTIIGLGGQFDSSSPYTEGYQLLPRKLEDLKPVSSVKDAISNQVRVFPNPTSGQLFIASKLNIQKIDIVNSIGKIVVSKSGNIHILNTQNLQPGCYWLMVTTENGVGVKNFIKQ